MSAPGVAWLAVVLSPRKVKYICIQYPSVCCVYALRLKLARPLGDALIVPATATAHSSASSMCIVLGFMCGLWDLGCGAWRVGRGPCMQRAEFVVCRVAKLKYMILPATSASVRTTHVCTHCTRYSARFAEVSRPGTSSRLYCHAPSARSTTRHPLAVAGLRTAHRAQTRYGIQTSRLPAPHPRSTFPMCEPVLGAACSVSPPRRLHAAVCTHHCGVTAA